MRFDLSDDQLKGSPAVLGGSLMSKPTWWNTFGCSATSAFFIPLVWHSGKEREALDGEHQFGDGEASCLSRV